MLVFSTIPPPEPQRAQKVPARADRHTELAVERDWRPWKSGSAPPLHPQGPVYLFLYIYIYIYMSIGPGRSVEGGGGNLR